MRLVRINILESITWNDANNCEEIIKIAIKAIVDSFEKELPNMKASPGAFGMKLSGLREERLERIFSLYGRIVGGSVLETVYPISMHLKYILDTLEHTNAVEFRFGSGLNGGEKDGKLFVWHEKSIFDSENKVCDKVIRFSFDPNIIYGNEADQMQWSFEESIDKMLVEWGLNIKL